MSKGDNTPLRKTMCATCPFRKGSPYADLVPDLATSAIRNSSRICHSTGSSAIHRYTGKKPHLCRGARDIQLEFFVAIGFLPEATDKAWNDQRKKSGMKPTFVKDP